MTEFTKTKMHFALALLGTLFALHPFIEKIQDEGFTYVGVPLKHFYVYALIAGLLALAVYCYAVALLSERPSSLVEKVGNYLYAFAIMALPLYGALYLSSVLERQLQGSQFVWVAQAAPAVAPALGVLWVLVSQVLAWRLRKRLGEQDRSAKVTQLVDQEIGSLNRAREMFASHHYDLSVIEAWKAIEARLRRVLLLRRISSRSDSPQAMIRAATRANILGKRAAELLQQLRAQWNIAVSTEPLTKEAAEDALGAARSILATIAIEEPGKTAKHTV